MRTISVINLKGGVAKTTTSFNVGHILAIKHNYRILFVDNDKQGNLTKMLKLYNPNNTCGMARILRGGSRGVINKTEYKNIDLISANLSLLTANMELAELTDEDQYSRLKSFLNSVSADYDFCIIDNPPDISLSVINALAATRDVIVPIKLDEWALEGLDIIYDQIDQARALNPSIALAGCLVTIFRKNDINIVAEEWIRKESGYPVFLTKIRYSEKIDESIFTHKGIMEHSRRSAAAIDYNRFVNEYLLKTDIEEEK